MHDDPSSAPAEEPASISPPSAHLDASPPSLSHEQPVVDPAIQHPSGAVPLFSEARPQQENVFYTREGDEPGWANEAAPFQLSGAQPLSPPADTSATAGASAPPVPPAQRWPWQRFLLLGLPFLIVALLLVGTLIGFAAPSRGLITRGDGPPPVGGGPSRSPSTVPSPLPTPSATGQGSSWQLQQLPLGWMTAGLSRGDAAFAMRTAMTFTDREMSLDFRNMGTRAIHSGTLTAATFLLTPASRARFQQNDVRVINNVLFDRLTSEQMIQAVVDETPQLVRFQAQGQQQFAWVEVSFHLWQSRLDPTHPGQRIEGLEADPASGQPQLHRMSVLLLRVAPGTQGATAPMGGTGWLVSNYGLDLVGQTVVDLVEPA